MNLLGGMLGGFRNYFRRWWEPDYIVRTESERISRPERTQSTMPRSRSSIELDSVSHTKETSYYHKPNKEEFRTAAENLVILLKKLEDSSMVYINLAKNRTDDLRHLKRFTDLVDAYYRETNKNPKYRPLFFLDKKTEKLMLVELSETVVKMSVYIYHIRYVSKADCFVGKYMKHYGGDYVSKCTYKIPSRTHTKISSKKLEYEQIVYKFFPDFPLVEYFVEDLYYDYDNHNIVFKHKIKVIQLQDRQDDMFVEYIMNFDLMGIKTVVYNPSDKIIVERYRKIREFVKNVVDADKIKYETYCFYDIERKINCVRYGITIVQSKVYIYHIQFAKEFTCDKFISKKDGNYVTNCIFSIPPQELVKVTNKLLKPKEIVHNLETKCVMFVYTENIEKVIPKPMLVKRIKVID